MQQYTPYTYLLGWSTPKIYYYGVRYSKKSKCLYLSGCHPDDLWNTYFTSSEYVKNTYLLYGNPDIIQIRKTFNTAKEALNWEKKVLTRMKLHQRPDFLNKCAGGSIFNDEDVRRKVSLALKGKPFSQEHKDNIRKSKQNISPEIRANMSRGQRSKSPPTIETRIKRSKSMKKLHWYNNGNESKRLLVCPEGWTQGRLTFTKTTTYIKCSNCERNISKSNFRKHSTFCLRYTLTPEDSPSSRKP